MSALAKKHVSLKIQAIAALAAIVGAVALPQVFHIIGAVSGLGTAPGETFLPMHLPVILAGLLAGPYAGAAAGLLGPLTSSLITGMPMQAMLPFMMTELCVYGLTAGLLRNINMPVIAKVVIVQAAGRAIRAAAILISINAFGNETIYASVIWNSIAVGLPGLIIQWSLIPLIMFRLENLKKHEQ